MKRIACVVVCFVGLAAWAADPPRKETSKATAAPDTRSDYLRNESVKVPAARSDVRLNLNRASVTELAKLPGVGEARARAIVKGRPYRSKEELVKRKIVSDAVYEDIKGNLYAGR